VTVQGGEQTLTRFEARPQDRNMKVLFAAGLLGIWSLDAASAAGPTRSELAQALAAEPHSAVRSPASIRRVRCSGFEEEPTEFACTWQQRELSGRWSKWSTYVAIDGSGWSLIDDAVRVQGRVQPSRAR